MDLLRNGTVRHAVVRERYHLNAILFSLSKHEFDLIVYGFIVLTESVVLLFFLIPWLAIRLVLRKTEA